MTAQLQLPFCDEKTPEEKFRDFHARHPEVYRELRRRAFEAKKELEQLWERKGLKVRCGIRMLWERMRWFFWFETDVEDDGLYRMNDHYTRHYSRLLMDNEPELEGFFETRERKS